MRDQPRQCRKCGYKWWAAKARPPKKLRGHTTETLWYTASFGLGTTFNSAGKQIKRSHNANVAASGWEHYSRCRRCGASSIATPSRSGFTPTAVEEAPGPSPASVRPGRVSFTAGDRVVVQQLGYRGKHGLVAGKGLAGYKVRIDGAARDITFSAAKLVREG